MEGTERAKSRSVRDSGAARRVWRGLKSPGLHISRSVCRFSKIRGQRARPQPRPIKIAAEKGREIEG